MNPKTNSPLQTAIKIAIIVVIIVVLLLISFAMIRLVPAVFSSISRFKDTLSFFGNQEKIVLALDKRSISDEERVVLSWRQERGNGEGEHVFNYSCHLLDDDTHLELTEANGDTRSVFCEEKVSLGNAGESDFRKISFTGFSDADEDQILYLIVSHVGATSTSASSTIPLTIKKTTSTDTPEEKDEEEEENVATSTPEKTPTKTTPTQTKPTTVITKPTNSYRTPVDLGAVFTKSDINSNDDGVIEFQVVNYGQNPSGQWRFKAILPQNGDDVEYISPYQSSIPGGKASIMTLRFENADSGTVVVTVDHGNQIQEGNESNNVASVKIN